MRWWSAGSGKKRCHCTVGQRHAHLKPDSGGNHALLLQLTEDEIRIDRIPRVAEPPAPIAEANLPNPGLDAELELVVHTLRAPAFDPVFIRRGPPQGLDFRVPVQHAICDAVNPVSPIADFAIRHIGQIRPQGRTNCPKDLLDGIERYATYQQELTRHSSLLLEMNPHSPAGTTPSLSCNVALPAQKCRRTVNITATAARPTAKPDQRPIGP